MAVTSSILTKFTEGGTRQRLLEEVEIATGEDLVASSAKGRIGP
jgi:hypothetical protein